MKYILLLLMTTLTLACAGFGYFCLHSPGSEAEAVIFEVRPGESFTKVTNRLKKQKLISEAFLFKVLAKLTGHTTQIRTGEYSMNRGMMPMQILNILATGQSVTYSITFPEGMNIYEMAVLIEEKGLGTKQEFLNLVTDKALIRELTGENLYTLEGYLFPETYKYTKYDSLESLVELMVSRFLTVYNQLDHTKAVAKFSRHQWVTLASIIEKETGYHVERKYISSVFHNRLKKNMRLQTDPTVLYGILDETKKITNNIRKKDLRRKTKFNTYRFSGLPYGPISNPGRDALLAAMEPAQTNYLYFVSRNNGTSHFSKTLKEHNKAVREYQLNSQARKGKSWRDLYKKNGAAKN